MLAWMLSLLLLAGSYAAGLKFEAPQGWKAVPLSSSMRVADFSLARAAGDGEDATATVYFFGAQQGGGVQANLDRWVSQMAQPDGRPSQSVARTSSLTVHSLRVALVDVTGTYVAEKAPGSTEHFNKPDFRQIAAVVETPGGNYYLKLTGPAKTIAKWHDSFMVFVNSLRFE